MVTMHDPYFRDTFRRGLHEACHVRIHVQKTIKTSQNQIGGLPKLICFTRDMMRLVLLLWMYIAATRCDECPINNKECVFHFEVEHRLTMMHNKDLVFPASGNIYKYDVTNTTEAVPVNTDEVITGDGWETPRMVAVVNKQLPGPDIIVYEGQTVIVYVKNLLTSQAITIHWHGLHQTDTPWMDGVPYVTQCPILPGQTFKYQFKAKPKGTFWWHSHVGTSRSMGLFGAFIIRERIETKVEEHIMQIQDWNHRKDSDMTHMDMLFGAYEGRKPWHPSEALDGSFFSLFQIHSALINGRGRYYDPKSGTSNEAPLTVYHVENGKTYRFRVISTGSLYPFRISVDGHIIKVIASDGYDLEPVEAESFIINPGERFDFEFTADQAVGNYWIRGITLEKGTPHKAEAILRYNGASAREPMTQRRQCTANDQCLVLNCPFTYYPEPHTVCRTFDELKSAVTNDPAPAYSTNMFKEFFLNFAFPGVKTYPGSVNGRSFHTPDVNPLLQPKEWNSPCQSPECGDDRHCKCTHAVNIGNGETVQMVFLNMGRGKGWSHPIHMHGHSFYVVKMGYGQYNATTGQIGDDNTDIDCRGHPDPKETFCNDATWRNQDWLNGNVPNVELDRPPRKDTIIVPTGGYVVIRIRADNPGIWNMHCHIELHNIDGMQMLINESFADVPKAPKGFPKCHSFPPSDYRLSMEGTEEDEGGDTGLQTDKPDSKEIDTDSYMKTIHYEVLLGLLIAVISLQLILGVGLCCVFKKTGGSSADKYDMSHNNPTFNGK